MSQPNGISIAGMHPNVQTILGYLPLVMQAVIVGLTINNQVGHVPVSQIITESLQAGAAFGMQVPESHVQMVAGIVNAITPTIASMLPVPAPAPAITVTIPIVKSEAETTPILDGK